MISFVALSCEDCLAGVVCEGRTGCVSCSFDEVALGAGESDAEDVGAAAVGWQCWAAAAGGGGVGRGVVRCYGDHDDIVAGGRICGKHGQVMVRGNYFRVFSGGGVFCV